MRLTTNAPRPGPVDSRNDPAQGNSVRSPSGSVLGFPKRQAASGWVADPLPRRLLLCALVALSGCAVLREQPTDAKIAGLHWFVSLPDFRVRERTWTVVNSKQMLDVVCGTDWSWNGKACVIRIIEGGQCLVFSTLTVDQAEAYITFGGDSLLTHEYRHCGDGMPSVGGWSHRE